MAAAWDESRCDRYLDSLYPEHPTVTLWMGEKKKKKNEIFIRRRMKVVLNRVLISLMREVLKGWLFKCIIINRRLSSVQSLFTYSL